MENRNSISARLRTDSYSEIGRDRKSHGKDSTRGAQARASMERSCCSIFSDQCGGNSVRALKTAKRNPIWGCSSAGRAPALQAGGQGFDSLHLHQRSKDRGVELKAAENNGL